MKSDQLSVIFSIPLFAHSSLSLSFYQLFFNFQTLLHWALIESPTHSLLIIHNLAYNFFYISLICLGSHTPIFLETINNHPNSFILISLIFCTSKLFERMVLGRFTYFLKYNILSPVQAGFRPGR